MTSRLKAVYICMVTVKVELTSVSIMKFFIACKFQNLPGKFNRERTPMIFRFLVPYSRLDAIKEIIDLQEIA